jgi:AraC-like DNA-binding protein
MLNGPTALAMTLAPLAETLREHGVDFDELARQAGVDPTQLARPNARYPSARVQRLWRLAAQAASNDPLLGVRVGSRVRPGTYHALGLGIVSSTSLLAALQRIERYSSVISTNGRFVLVAHGDSTSLETRPHERTVLPDPHWFDAMVVGLVRLLELCAGPTAKPALVRMPSRSAAPREALAAALGCPVESDASHVAIVFDAARVTEPMVSGNAELAAEADRIAARCIEDLAPDSAASRVRALILQAMPSGGVDQDRIARALNQSASTLQRRLRREGTNYQRLLDATRRELALDYLKDGRHSLADITFLLGFADQSNFTRAFRRWTGKTPRQFLS